MVPARLYFEQRCQRLGSYRTRIRSTGISMRLASD